MIHAASKNPVHGKAVVVSAGSVVHLTVPYLRAGLFPFVPHHFRDIGTGTSSPVHLEYYGRRTVLSCPAQPSPGARDRSSQAAGRALFFLSERPLFPLPRLARYPAPMGVATRRGFQVRGAL